MVWGIKLLKNTFVLQNTGFRVFESVIIDRGVCVIECMNSISSGCNRWFSIILEKAASRCLWCLNSKESMPCMVMDRSLHLTLNMNRRALFCRSSNFRIAFCEKGPMLLLQIRDHCGTGSNIMLFFQLWASIRQNVFE